ncbi:MAG: threonine synthase [Bacteroidia bacterium]|nr:threonine synthase [Bacteroidia bacterium]
MKFYSTNNKNHIVDLKTAVLESLPPDNGLYMPETTPKLSSNFISKLSNFSFEEIAFEISRSLLKEDLSESEILTLCSNSINFPAPLAELDDVTFVLELFHGPSLAFKDFGARYMAQLMSVLNREDDRQLTILVATSGDTGGAVAAGFLNTPGINVHILYPSGKVSFLQEKQLTTLGGNIHAFEVDGTFDDCQSIVKQAFLDTELNKNYRLSSANSINIARLIPQSFYYFEAYKQVMHRSLPVVFSVPSGNFGNLTAGILAKRMGLPVEKYIAATNINKVIPDFLETGLYQPRPSKATISNAMDVGAPSNFARMQDIYQSDLQSFQKELIGYWFNDDDTKAAMKEIYDQYGYVIDPHGAVGYLATKAYRESSKDQFISIIHETAHPSKFLDVVEQVIGNKIDIPERLSSLSGKEKKSTVISSKYEDFKSWMLAQN